MKFYPVQSMIANFTVNGRVYRFENGFIETEDEDVIKELSASPYATTSQNVAPPTLGEVLAPQLQAVLAEEPDLTYYKLASRITVEDAKRYAEERNIPYPENVTKEELLEAINTNQAEKIK